MVTGEKAQVTGKAQVVKNIHTYVGEETTVKQTRANLSEAIRLSRKVTVTVKGEVVYTGWLSKGYYDPKNRFRFDRNRICINPRTISFPSTQIPLKTKEIISCVEIK
jgi:hypothetical protein